MHVDIFEHSSSFNALKPHWEAVYRADPDANLFLSWTWLSRWCSGVGERLLVLAVRPAPGTEDYVAFLPLRWKTRMRRNGVIYNELVMAGSKFADYTGVLCRPEFDETALPALRDALQKLHWARLNFENVRMSEKRIRLLLDLPAATFEMTSVATMMGSDGSDNAVCPYLELPPTWDQYLATLNQSRRGKIRRFMRKVENGDEFRITTATAESFEGDLEVMLGLWARRWRAQKGAAADKIMGNMRSMLRHCLESGLLFMPVLWHGDRRVAVLALASDRDHQTMYFLVTGRTDDIAYPPTGHVLIAYSIRHAIASGLKRFDFLRGDYDYKHHFGPQVRRISNIAVETRDRLNHTGRLDVRSVPEALPYCDKLLGEGRFAEAGNALEQILSAAPRTAAALDGLGRVKLEAGDIATAKALFARALKIDAERARAWLGLARSLELEKSYEKAAAAYREGLRRDPKSASGFSGLGNVLGALGRHDEQIRAYETAMRLQPNYRAAELNRANALFVRGTLPEDKRQLYAGWNADAGEHLVAAGAADRAPASFRLALAMDPTCIEAHRGLARLLERKGDLAGAIRHYRRALDLTADTGELREHVARLAALASLDTPSKSRPTMH